MYSRTLEEGQPPITLGVSGKLWAGVLVLYDVESDSLWTQIGGRALQGPAAGRKLQQVHSEFVTWEVWRTAHPDTLVLDKDEEDRAREGSHYTEYFTDPDAVYFPELTSGLGGAAPKSLVFGVAIKGETLAVTEALLREQVVINAVVAGTPVAFLFDPETGFARAVERRLGERVLILEPLPGRDPSLLSQDLASGETRSASELPPLRLDRAFWFAWKHTHPGSRILAH